MASKGSVGTAYVTILPDMSAFAATAGKAVARSLGGASKSLSSSLAAGVKSGLSTARMAIGNALGDIVSSAASAVTGKLSNAISRADTMNNFPIIMSNMGYSADDAQASINKLSDGIDGLPTALDSIVSATQKIAPLTGSLDEATDVSLALNNALLAGGKSTELQANALEQYSQMLSVGKVDMAAWRSMVNAMPAQMTQLAQSLVGPTANSMDLYEAMKAGTVTFEDFNDALVKLNAEGGDGFASFAEQAKGATQGLGTAITNVGNRITKALVNVLDYINKDNRLTTWINDTSSQFGGWSKKIVAVMETVEPYVVRLFNVFQSTGGQLLTVFSPLKGLISQVFTVDTLEKVVSLVEQMSSKLAPLAQLVYDLLSGWTTQLVGALWPAIQEIGAALAPLLPQFVSIMKQVGDMLVSAATSALPVISGLITQIAPYVQQILTFVQQILTFVEPYIPTFYEFLGGVINYLFQAVDTLLPAIQNLVGALVPYVEALWGALQQVFSFIMPYLPLVDDFLAGIINWVAELAADALPGILEFLQPIIDGAISLASDVAPAIFNTAMAIGDTLGGIWSAAQPALSAFSEATGSILATVGELVGSLLEPTANTLLPIIGDVANVIFGILTSIFETVGPLVQYVADLAERHLPPLLSGLSEIWNGTLKPLVEEVGEFIGNLIRASLPAIKRGIEALKPVIDVIGDALQWIWDHILSPILGGITEALNFLNGNLEASITAENRVTPDSIEAVHGDGGITTRPHQALVGERGPEAIIPLTEAGVQPLANALANAGASDGAKVEVTIVNWNNYDTDLDMSTLGDRIATEADRKLKQAGQKAA